MKRKTHPSIPDFSHKRPPRLPKDAGASMPKPHAPPPPPVAPKPHSTNAKSGRRGS